MRGVGLTVYEPERSVVATDGERSSAHDRYTGR